MTAYVTLTKRSEFLATAEHGRKWVTPLLVIQSRTRDDMPSPLLRAGFTATKRIGGAVVRNRAKRRMRALVHKLAPELNPGLCVDIVVIARHDAPKAPARELEKQMRYALRKLGVIGLKPAPDGEGKDGQAC